MNYFNKKSLFPLLEILILALPLTLIIGAFAAEIILLTSIIIFIICIKREKKDFFLNNKLVYFFFFFYLYFLFNSILSSTPQVISFKIFFFFRFVFLLLIINYILDKNENFLMSLAKVILAIFFVLFLDSLIQKITGINLFGQQIINSYRVSSFFGDELIMGGYIARFSPLLLFGYFLFKNEKLRTLSVIFYFASFYFILISGERSAVILAIISFFYSFLFLDIKKKVILKSIIIFIAFLTLIIANDSKIKTRIFKHYVEQISHNSSSKNLFLKFIPIQILDNNENTLKMFKKNNLFGLGPYSFRYFCEEKIQKKVCKGGHPHNSYLQLLAETGYIGILYFFIPLLFLIFFQIKMKFKRDKNKLDYNLFTLGSCLVFLIIWPINQHGNIFNNWLNIAYYFSFSIYIYLFKKNHEFVNYRR